MVIYSPEGTPVLRIKVDDSSYLYEEVMGDANIVLEFSLTEHIELEPGSFVEFRGAKYELLNRSDVNIQHSRDYQYKATFSGPQARFSRYVIYNFVDGRVRFDMIGKPWDHLSMVVDNLNNRERGMWSIGSYVDKPEALVSYSHTNIRDALSAIAEAFDTEWSVERNGNGFVINLRKNEFYKDSPLPLGYGKNQGFKPGVGRVNFGEFGQVEKVWIDGGERNLSIGEYGWTTLHFPPGLSFSVDAEGKLSYMVGGALYTQGGFDWSSALEFVTDDWGSSVRLQSASQSCNEVSLDLTQYYPKHEGTVTGVYYLYKGRYLTYSELVSQFPGLTKEDWLEIQVDIVDDTLDGEVVSGSENGLDYSQYLLSPEESLTVIFQSGQLIGREFNAKFVKEAKTRTQINEETGVEETIVIRPANRFELVRATIDGEDMPNAAFRPNAIAGADPDKYIVVNVYMPNEYIRDLTHFKGAELDALRAACKFIRDNKDPQFSFKGTVDDLYAKRNWTSISSRIVLGGCISFQNASIQPTPVVTRIIGIKTYINSPYAPELTLSNETVRAGMASTIAKLKADDEHVVERVKEARRFSQRSFRDAKETISMLAGTIDYFSEGINPITVETMSLLVGYEALQFRFWTNRNCNTPVVNPVVYDPDTQTLRVGACVIQHMTHGITDVKPSDSRHFFDYLRWSMSTAEFGPSVLTGVDELGNDNSASAFYLYAKVDAANVAKADGDMTTEELIHIYGEFVLTKEKKDIKEKLTPTDTEYRVVDGVNTEFSYFYLLVGILNSEYEGGRSFAPMYGFTEVLPGQITTDVIRSALGDSYFDLANNQFALGNSLQFLNDVLTLRGALVVTGAGDAVPMGAWCGEFEDDRTYAYGDEVWAEVNGEVITFRYVYNVPSNLVNPPYPYVTNEQYWLPVAKGKNGTPGTPGPFKSTVFMRTNDDMDTVANTPSGGSYGSPFPNSTHTDSATGDVLTWEDGIPDGEAKLWASSCTFNYDNTSSGWSRPRQMTDTDTYDVEFAKMQTNDADPPLPTDANRHGGSGTQVWFDPDLDSSEDFKQMYWRAERECRNGLWKPWTIIRIKGEKGDATPAVSVDLSNEVDGLAVGSDGILDVAGGVTLETIVSAFYGTDATTITGIRAAVPSGYYSSRIGVKLHGTSTSIVSASYITTSAQTISLDITIATGTDFTGDATVPISIYVRVGTFGERELSFTIIPVKDGEDGSVFKLMPDYDVVKGVPGSNSVTYTPTTVHCTRMLGKGGNFAESTYGYLRYSVDGGTTKSAYTSSGVAVSSAVNAGKIIFYWYADSNNTLLLDQETVPIVTDGAAGEPGDGVQWVRIYYGTSMTKNMPASWTLAQDGQDPPDVGPGVWLWIKTVTHYYSGAETTTYTKSLSGGNGAVCAFRGEWNQNEAYYGQLDQTDIVIHEGKYYRASPLAPASPFTGIAPGNGAYWLEFITQYDNLATGFAFIERLVVQQLNTAGEGNETDKRIVARGNALSMYDGSSNEPRLVISGDDLSGFNQSTSVTFPAYNYAVNDSGTWQGGEHYETESTGISFNVASGANVKPGGILALPALALTLEAGLTTNYQGEQLGTVVFNIGWKVNGGPITAKQFIGQFGKVGNVSNVSYYANVNLQAATIPLQTGTNTVKLYASVDMFGCQDAIGTHNFKLYAYNSNSASLPVTYPTRKTEIGANGFQVAFGSDQMLKCIIEGSLTTFLLRSNNVGIELSSSGTGTGTMRIMIGGTWYYAKYTNGYLGLSTTP